MPLVARQGQVFAAHQEEWLLLHKPWREHRQQRPYFIRQHQRVIQHIKASGVVSRVCITHAWVLLLLLQLHQASQGVF
jgi:hypothetical protein